MKVWVAVPAILIGVTMIAQWVVALRGGRVPELTERPAEIRLHLAAEFATAAVLIVGALMTLATIASGAPLLLFGLGMLTYTAIVSPGYFVDRGERGPIAMFAVIVVLALVSAIALIADLSG